MRVWILEEGENYEGGSIQGIYASQASAEAAFNARVEEMRKHWNDVVVDPVGADGTLSASGGCDWLTCKWYDVSPY